MFAAFCGDDEPDRREVWTLRYEVEAGTRNAPRRDTLLAEGRVPGERISGIIAGVLRRSGERGEPPTAEIDGKSARWEALVRELQVEPADSG